MTENLRDVAPPGPPVMRDSDAAHPVPGAWRPMLREVVRRLARGDYALAGDGIPGVAPVTAPVAAQIRDYVADYGATLVELPEDAWQTSVVQWTGARWDLLVDLWTAEEGRSDLVLGAEVVETADGPLLMVNLVYVP